VTVRSMTGFGAAVIDLPMEGGASQRYRIALRSVNHRFLDVKVRAGRELAALEVPFATRVKERLSRGHVDAWIEADPEASAGTDVTVNRELAAQINTMLQVVQRDLSVKESITMDALTAFPEVVVVSRRRVDPEDQKDAFLAGLDRGLDALVLMREAEGERLAEDLRARVDALRAMVQQLFKSAPGLVDSQRQRLDRRLGAMLGGTAKLDPARLEQEVAILADKTDVSEELTRLSSHLDQFVSELNRTPAGRGKKLEFLTQELLREVNTVGSKVGDADVTSVVIDAKCELEKVREQVANLE
jgi:uncharacterized protein (TIGR00255 family)